MMITYIFCSAISLFDSLQNYLIPCPFKYLTHIDCPGCGFQRSLIALLQGDLAKSWSIYPPTIPLILLLITIGVSYPFPISNRSIMIKTLVILVGNFVVFSYLIKMFGL